MVKLISANGNVQYGIDEYVIDSVDDLELIPTRAGMGCMALDLSTSNTYVKNGLGQWILIKSSSSEDISGDYITMDELTNDLTLTDDEIFDLLQ